MATKEYLQDLLKIPEIDLIDEAPPELRTGAPVAPWRDQEHMRSDGIPPALADNSKP